MTPAESLAVDWQMMVRHLDEEVDRLRRRLLALAAVLPSRYQYYLHHDAPATTPPSGNWFDDSIESTEPTASDVVTEIERLWRRL